MGTPVSWLLSRPRYFKPVRAASSGSTDVMALLYRPRFTRPVRAPSSVGTDVMVLLARFSTVRDGPSSPRLGGSAPPRPRKAPATLVGSCTPPSDAGVAGVGSHSTKRPAVLYWQYGSFARSFHGGRVGSVASMPASCSSAVHAQGFSRKAERSTHSADTAVPPGQMLPAAQAMSSQVQGQMLPEAGAPCGQAATQVTPLTKVAAGHELTHVSLTTP